MIPVSRVLLPLLIFLISTLFPGKLFSQSLNPYYQKIVSGVSYDTVLANLQKLQSLGIKEPGTAALDNTANWLIEKYQSYGYSNISRDNFTYNGNQLSNLVITKMGSIFPPSYLIIDGHYDTYQGPGVNDNGSGVACILEIARLLSNIPTEFSIKFIHFSAEEEGLIGSQHYVDEVVQPTNMNIRLVFNIDEVGGVSGMVNNTITCERDEDQPASNNAASFAFTDTLVNLTKLYSNLQTKIYYAYGSDYVPFQEVGEVITGFYESNESPYPHSPGDVLENMSPAYVTQVAKAATGAALYFAGAGTTSTSVREPEMTGMEIYPNPVGKMLQWRFHSLQPSYRASIFSFDGKMIAEKAFYSSLGDSWDVSALRPGLYLVRFSFENGNSYEKRILKR